MPRLTSAHCALDRPVSRATSATSSVSPVAESNRSRRRIYPGIFATKSPTTAASPTTKPPTLMRTDSASAVRVRSNRMPAEAAKFDFAAKPLRALRNSSAAFCSSGESGLASFIWSSARRIRLTRSAISIARDVTRYCNLEDRRSAWKRNRPAPMIETAKPAAPMTSPVASRNPRRSEVPGRRSN